MSVMHSSMSSDNNQLTLVELLELLWKKKHTIFTSVLVFFLMALTYIMLAKPTYEASVKIAPPSNSDIKYLNIGRNNLNLSNSAQLKILKKDVVYNKAKEVLLSEQLKQNFFKQIYLPAVNKDTKGDSEKLFKGFLKALTIKQLSSSEDTYLISIRSHDADQAVQWIETYLSMFRMKAVDKMDDVLKHEKMNLLKDLNFAIQRIKKYQENEVLIQINQLKDALVIAKTMAANQANNTIILDVKNDKPKLLALQGTTVLEAELKNLTQNRILYNPKLLNLQSDYNFYKKIDVPKDKINVFRINHADTVQSTLVPVKKKYILIGSLFTGLMLGCFMVLLNYFSIRIWSK